MKGFTPYLIGILCIATYSVSTGQVSVKSLKRQGHKAYVEGRYRDAAESLRQYDELRPGKKDVLTELGISCYYINRLNEGLHYMLSVEKNKRRFDPLLYYYIGRTYHHLENFNEAASYYKKYIVEGDDNQLIEASKAQLLRCEAGKKIIRDGNQAFVDNMHAAINTPLNEFKPVLSPTFSSKLYFSAESLDSTRRDEGLHASSTDIYVTEKIDGKWQSRGFMNPALNTDDYEILYDFSSGGQVAYYFRGENQDFGYLYTDTFSVEQDPLRSTTFLPANPAYGDRDIFLINDTTIIFAAIREEGYGGYDLYIAQYTEGKWSSPKNLGPEVNSPYNERAPFITGDLETIIFSSDRPYSMGGYDFFLGKWNQKAREYKDVVNMGKPLNSPGDDMHFVMTDDGVTCFFSSNRKTGLGGYDIYTGYFRKPFAISSTPSPTTEQQFFTGIAETEDIHEQSTPEIKEEVTITSVSYADGDIFSPHNILNYDKIVNILQSHPNVDLRIQVFSDDVPKKSIDLYLSIKTGEQIAQYIMDKGIDGHRLHIIGCGSAYPLARERTSRNINLERINSRIDFYLTNTENTSLDIVYRLPPTPPGVDKTAFQIFDNYNTGLSYRVQIAAYTQRYSSPLLESGENALIQKSADEDIYIYTLGLFKTYVDASSYLLSLNEQGITDGFIRPFIDGIRKQKKELEDLEEVYPDLRHFLGTDK